MEKAIRLYDAYRKAVGGKSAVTGDLLPELERCPSLVIQGWIAVAREAEKLFNKRIDDVLWRNSRGVS